MRAHNLLSILGVLTITGYLEALTISAAQPQVIGYENDSIVLAVSYETDSRTNWLQIRWNIIHPKPLHLIICTIRSGNLSNHIMFPENGYESRMTVDPKSGSLKVKHLKTEDGGTYNVSILDTQLERWTLINVTVLRNTTEERLSVAATENPALCLCNSTSVNVPTSAWILLGSRLSSVLIAVLVLLGIHFINRSRPPRRPLKVLASNHGRW
ncbi:uncharacterized protein [Eleutherodactylus coqui]|uniref:uncharacterized protein n=1 Tax=Eleutherodactylus coqui TaxID=57060 RepID=UPI00346297C1